MRMSCNGCRVLRKGCSDNCSIRPCLQWIKNPESQAHATVFLAKFYGRAGLMNLVNAGPDHLRPAIFRSLLYEACGRIVNPIYGSVGLLWSGSWPLCQAAVEAVLKGEPIVTIPTETAASNPVPPFKAYDIRHVTKNSGSGSDPLKVTKTRNRFKRSGNNNNNNIKRVVNLDSDPSHDSSNGGGGSHVTEQGEIESGSSVGGEASHVSTGAEESDVELELTLGLAGRVWHPARAVSEGARAAHTCGVELGL